MFLAILFRIRSRIFFWVALEMEMGGYMWMRTSGVEVACVSERASES